MLNCTLASAHSGELVGTELIPDSGSDSGQQVDAGRDAYVARGDITIYNNGGTEDFRPPFLVVDQAFLNEEQRKPKVPYIARPPLWADVVHGQNADARFLEREQFGSLLSAIERQLLEPLRRGSDRRLHTLFVTGAPGCGKSTLVRHAAAALVQRGDVIVADLGVNHGRLIADDLDSYVKGLAQLAAADLPVLLLMDDPFFANSGWDLLLETLARPNYSGIAILGASPTYLYETYGRPLAGHQIVLNPFSLGATTGKERLSLAEMYGVKSHQAIDRREDLLVFAMETASGSSFTEIIERIWSTLNDGLAIAPKAGMADVEWPVLAFLLTSYLHRHYVLCPEALLRAYLVDLAGNMRTDFIRELSELTLSEGWNIFRVFQQDSGSPPTAMIGTMHARVAERAWQVRPFKAIDQISLLARASAQGPRCAPQLAEFILACQSSKDSRDRGLASKVAEEWRSDRISTAELSALVRGLRSTPAAIPFRGVLRERLKRRDSQSWLAVAELIPLERPRSPARERLSQGDFPYSLTLADLSADSSAAIDLLGREGSPRRAEFAAYLRDSLEGKRSWELDGKLLTWLLRNNNARGIRALLTAIYDWLDAHPDDERARVALIEWHTANVAMIGSAEAEALLDRVREWVSLLPDNQKVISAFFTLAAVLLTRTDALPVSLIEEMSSWVELRSDDAYLRERFLRLLAQHYSRAPQIAADAVTETLAWLAIEPESNDVRLALLGLVLAEPAHPQAPQAISEALTWLGQHPSDNRVHDAWAQLFRVIPAAAAVEAMPEVLAWLSDHADALGARLALSALARVLAGHPHVADIVDQTRAWLSAHPDDGPARVGFLALVGELPGLPHIAEIIAESRRWLLSRPGDGNVRGAFLALTRGLPGYLEPAEVVRETLVWLADRPDDEEGHLTLLRLARGVPVRPEAAEAVAETVRWLDGRRGGTETWVALFGLVHAVPGYPKAAEVVTEARRWLAAHTDDVHVRTRLLSFVRTIPERPQAAEVIAETRDWLAEHPEDTNVRASLLGLEREFIGPSALRQHLAEARAQLDNHPDDELARNRVLSLAREVAEPPETAEIIAETVSWLEAHHGGGEMWIALFGLVRAAGYPQAAEVVTATRRWLAAHPADQHVRTGFLAFIRTMPDRPLAAEVVAETRDWLDDHPGDMNVRAALLGLERAASRSAAPLGQVRPGEIADARARLAKDREDQNARVRLLSLVRELRWHPNAAEIITEIRQWLDDHPDEANVRASLLRLMRALPEQIAATGIIDETRQWLRQHPSDSHVRSSFLSLLSALPEYPHTGECIAETLHWLDQHSGDVPNRLALLALIRERPEHPHATEAVAQTYEWLTRNPSDVGVHRGLRALVQKLPAELQAARIISEALQWLEQHPVATPAPDSAAGRPHAGSGEPPDSEEFDRLRAALDEHPDDSNVRADLFFLSLTLPENPQAAGVITDTFRWLSNHPDDARLRMSHLFNALRREMPDHPEIPALIEESRRWLADHPDDYGTRLGLLGLVRVAPASAATEEIARETRLWLLGQPEDSRSRASLLALVRVLPTHPEAAEVASEMRDWLAGHREAVTVREGLLALVRELPDNLQLAEEIASDTQAWLTDHPDSYDIRISLLILARLLAQSPVTREIIAGTRAWLAGHPDDKQNPHVRIELLRLVRELPEEPIRGDVISEARTWLDTHRGHRSAPAMHVVLHRLGSSYSGE